MIDLIKKHAIETESGLLLKPESLELIKSKLEKEYIYYQRWKERQRKYSRKLRVNMTLEEIEKERKRSRDHARKKYGIKPRNYRIKD
jgi:hypothetical protein